MTNRIVASFRASATRAFQLPDRTAIWLAHSRTPRAARLRYMMTLAASKSRRRVNRPPHFSAPARSVKDYGAFLDGASHPLSSIYGSLAAAQAQFPFATALT